MPDLAADTDFEIVQEIISQMKKGVLPWRRPWSDTTNVVVIGSMPYRANLWPSNLRAPAVPFGVYNGVILLMQARLKGYRTNLWITSKTRKTLNAPLVHSDQRPTKITAYYSDSDAVYNIDQIKDCEKTLGLSFQEQTVPHEMRYKSSKKMLETLVKHHALLMRPENKAAYSPTHDCILMPSLGQFTRQNWNGDGEAHYWATLWHEVVHWTGHTTRLKRKFGGHFGDQAYAFEELIAELGTAFLCAYLGIKGELQHASYIESWLHILQSGHKPLLDACKHAGAAKEYILDKRKDINRLNSTFVKQNEERLLSNVPFQSLLSYVE